jgi:GntR family histidine utilization transcriptional repressor
MTKYLPQYLQIKRHILENIIKMVYVAGSKIPPEVELAKTFGVSRMTVNKAITELANEGILVRFAGDGTYVAERKSAFPVLNTSNIANEIQQRGHVHRAEVLQLSLNEATADEAALLNVAVGHPVFFSQIVHYENELPVQLERRYINAHHVPDYGQQDFTAQTPNAFLLAHYPLTDLEHTIEAIVPDAEIQNLLKMSPKEACLVVLRRTWSGKKLIGYAQLLHVGSRYQLTAHIHLDEYNQATKSSY